MKTLISNATIVTLDAAKRILNDASILITNDRIEAIGANDDIARLCPNPDTRLDARHKVVMPGFVSAHNHLGYAVFRGRAEDIGHAPTHRLYLPMSQIISAEERQAIGALAVSELLCGGVTTVLEMEEDAELFAPFIERSGMRANIGVMVNDLNLEAMKRGQTVFDKTATHEQLEQATGLAERWHGRAGGRIQAIMAATGLSTSSRELLKGLRAAADDMCLRISIHLGFGERQLVAEVHGAPQFEFAKDMGVLGPDVVAVHCFEVNDTELEVLAGSGAHLAHCPHMNQFRGVIAPIQKMRQRGMNVGLGIDNYFSDFFEVLRSCIASARINAQDPEILSAYEALSLGTIESARVLGMDADIGSLEVGKKADLQIINLRRLGLTIATDPVATLVYHGHGKDVETVMVDGQIVVRDARLCAIDSDTLLEEASNASDAAWGRFVDHYGSYVAPGPG